MAPQRVRRAQGAGRSKVHAHKIPLSLNWCVFSLFLFFGVVFPGQNVEADRYPYDPKFSAKLVKAAVERTRHRVTYDGSYISIAYPGGDVPDNIGVCTDVIIRSYRALGVDLQKIVHEDMKANFGRYPKNWGLKKPDTNIDHRRVPNLQAFFRRHGVKLPVSRSPEHYLPGDIVTWTVAGRLPHIGIVSDRKTLFGKRPLIVHNIGRGPVLEDMLFEYPITGHYRYYGKQ